MKRLLATIITFIVGIAVFTGCASEPVTTVFQREGLTITLNDTFEDCTDDESVNVLNYTAVFSSDYEQTVIFAQREDFDLFEAAGIDTDISPEELAQLIFDAGLITDYSIETAEGITFFIYEESGVTYFATAQRGSDAYWIVQFYTYSERFDDMTETYLTWAKTVTVT